MAAVSTFPWTETPAKQEECKIMLCEKDKGTYILNTTVCSGNYKPSINNTKPYIVRIMTDPNRHEDHGRHCVFLLVNTKNHYINVTVMKVADKISGNFRLTLSEIPTFHSQYYLRQSEVTSEKLKNTNVSFLSLKHIVVYFGGTGRIKTRVITLYIDIKEGTYMSNLPVVLLSDTVGYITSPGFDDNKKYPNKYDGDFQLNVAGNQSLLVNFINFHVESLYEECAEDYLLLRLNAQGKQSKLCQWKNDISAFVFPSSLYIYFHTDNVNTNFGFKMMFVLLPKSHEPEQLPRGLFNCSVPSFYSFSPAFNCTLLTECEGGEDEQDCGYRSNNCGMEGAIDTGTKCYSRASHQEPLTWLDAHKSCIQRGQQLATLGTHEEFRQFITAVPPVVNSQGYFFGTQLMERLQAVPIAAMYWNIWQWVDGRTVFSVEIYDSNKESGSCALYNPWLARVQSVSCNEKKNNVLFLCEFYKQGEGPSSTRHAEPEKSLSIELADIVWNVSVIQCPSGHVTRDFLSCDSQADCGALYSMKICGVGNMTVPMFVCQQSRSTVHYTLVCDHMQHCSDNSDEDFCRYPDCSHTSMKCRNDQCIHTYQQCDGKLDCYDGSDENCQMVRHSISTTLPPGTIYLDGSGNFHMTQMNYTDECPQTHFPCPQDFCLPVYLLCNGVHDCPGREDEVGCNSYVCRGFYHCRGSKVCLHHTHVCDGVPHCPEQDDELLCDLVCPHVCRCQGLAFICNSGFHAASYLALRYLDASSSDIKLSTVRDNTHLVVLRVSECHITNLPLNMTFPNLRDFDLSWNHLCHLQIEYFYPLNNLRVLVLAGNPLVQITNAESTGSMKLTLEHVDLSYTNLYSFSGSHFADCSNLRLLNLSWSKLKSIAEEGFQAIPRLRVLDLRGCNLINFPNMLLRYLKFLTVVHTENYKLCCKPVLPVHFDLNSCHATQDLLASCEDLLKSSQYRVCLWIFASLSLVGNAFSVVTRLHQKQDGGDLSSFSVFVTNLSVADFFMGVYLAIIGTADLIYRGNYLWRDDEWKNSETCSIAGFLCLMSSETSAFIICLITLDRFLVLRFPFGRLHFGHQSALVACGVVWAVGISLASIPLFPMTSHWKFYSQTGICIPLPFTSSEVFSDYKYYFGVSILLNLVLFLLIAVGQVAIYLAVRASSMPSSTNTRARDAAIARRLVTVVMSDFLCWFPIGLLGLLASTGTPIPSYLNVVVAVFVLPINSALNPFLYTFNLLMEKRRKTENEKILKRLELERRSQPAVIKDKTKIITEYTSKATMIQQIQTWINEKLLTPDDLLSCSSAPNETR